MLKWLLLNDFAKETAQPQLTVSENVNDYDSEVLPENVEINENISINTIKLEPEEISIDPLGSDPNLDLNINLMSEEWIKDEGNESDVDALDATASKKRKQSLNIKWLQCQEIKTPRQLGSNSNHDKDISKEKKEKCNLCDYSTGTKEELKKHNEKHVLHNKFSKKEKTNYKCTECDFTTVYKEGMKRHFTNIHENKRKFQCHYCDYGVGNKWYLKEHIERSHLIIKNFECNVCDYKTNTAGSLIVHIKNVHYTRKWTFKCKHCYYIPYNSILLLKDHCVKYHKVAFEKFEEEIEKHAELTSSSNSQHESSTEIEKRGTAENFSSIRDVIKNLNSKKSELKKCQFCDHRSDTNLKQHIQSVHLKTENNKCDLCDFVANTKSSLTKHINAVHLKIKKEKCDLCYFRAEGKYKLRLHKKLKHSQNEIKKYSCSLCDYKTNLWEYLNSHIKYKHGEKLKCPYCDHTTSYQYNLKRHINKFHNEIKQER